LRNGPELDNCSKACTSLYRIAMTGLFSDIGGNGDAALRAVKLLKSENGPAASSFQTMLAAFLRKEVYPLCTKEDAKRLVSHGICSIETAKL
jgi:hypothetical protein